MNSPSQAIASGVAPAGSRFRRLVSSPWLRPFNDPVLLDGWLRAANPAWSLTETRARIVARIRETPETWTFVLRPNRRWKAFRAGQHVIVSVPIAGRRVLRCFSLSDAPGPEGHIAITVKRPSGGLLSGWLHDHARIGNVVTLGDPSGDFVLPEAIPERLLLLSAGSGITPMRAHLRDLHRRGWAGDVILVHACRNRSDAIFGDELERLAREWPALRLHFHYSDAKGRLDPSRLADVVPDAADRHTLLCGPTGFMDAVRVHWERAGLTPRLQMERFGAPRVPEQAATAVEIRCGRSNRQFAATTGATLLQQAEAAGLKPAFGCRAGICHTCKCRKAEGTVRNLVTGEVSSAPGELIQLCITTAQSDVTLDL